MLSAENITGLSQNNEILNFVSFNFRGVLSEKIRVFKFILIGFDLVTHFSVTSKSFEKEPLPSARASKAAESMTSWNNFKKLENKCIFLIIIELIVKRKHSYLALENMWENDDFAQKNCVYVKNSDLC
ncbi:hypothetical protein BpHYR1_050210 [Brachionus plicatilis]|uniref:Uncharacterized protein n=1 Tax=Brachionus plicatilis TaxID=10195 RepID=A0A3M7QEK0_BRAPC|nr:hypothetical protein BpHYR1_050210 [Brachionus plicatilis]